MLTFVTSQKGTRKLISHGFLFTKHIDGSDGKEIWRCERRSCKARLHTQMNSIVLEVGAHNHTVTHGQVEVKTARANMKRSAKSSEEATRSIVQNELLKLMFPLEPLVYFQSDQRYHEMYRGTVRWLG